MARLTLVAFLAIAVFTTTGFSWGRVFKDDKTGDEGAVMKPVPPERDPPATREEPEAAERPAETHEEKEKSSAFKEQGTGFKAQSPGFKERSSGIQEDSSPFHAAREGAGKPPREGRGGGDGRGPGSAGTKGAPVGVEEDDREIHDRETDAGAEAERAHPTGDRVEVVGVPRAREHHITDGLADAISGLMRVYNSLVRADGREWEGVHAGVEARANGTAVAEAPRGEGASSGGWAAWAVVAGIVLVGFGVAAIGLQRDRQAPVYPPRGPAYV